jgi:hypothetical protein
MKNRILELLGNRKEEQCNCMEKVKLTLAILKDGYFENVFARTSSFTSFPRSPQNKRKSSVYERSSNGQWGYLKYP